MLSKIWLIFAQACTICLAILFVVATLRPDLLGRTQKPSIVVKEEISPVANIRGAQTLSLSSAAKKAMPAVVSIYTSKQVRRPFTNNPLFRQFFGDEADTPQQRVSGTGSGVIVSDRGFVLTNYHVIKGADTIQLALADGRQLKASVLGTDPDTDLAVLKTAADNLPAITFGSSEGLQVGDVVLAIGNPFGLDHTVTSGIISALGRGNLSGTTTFGDFIQTDAAINPGNSGGALIDVAGNLIGINSNIFSRTGGYEGISFAIPVNLARGVMESIIEHGNVTRGWLGVLPQTLTADMAQAFAYPKAHGVVIARVVQNGPADQGGLRPGDIVIEIDGRGMEDDMALMNTIAGIPPGKVVPIKVWREGRERVLNVEVGTRPRNRS